MTAPLDLDAIRARAEAATPGPWAVPGANVFRVVAPEAEHHNPKQGMGTPYPWRIVADMGDPDGSAADATFITHARTDVPALLAEVERLRAEKEACIRSHQKANATLAELEAENEALRAESVPRSSLVQVGWWDSGVFVLRRTVTRSDPAYDHPVYIIREDTDPPIDTYNRVVDFALEADTDA